MVGNQQLAGGSGRADGPRGRRGRAAGGPFQGLLPGRGVRVPGLGILLVLLVDDLSGPEPGHFGLGVGQLLAQLRGAFFQHHPALYQPPHQVLGHVPRGLAVGTLHAR
ncbi:hypothetical protein SM007_28145 [Streptomyces avermitilis]|uniref:Uncharacterized protein n=1 Tax=Streptomyces avermitilis TaxID=33903 RepID=A0A4D4MBS2_STRAX|nr:hypothetical protein [Streptomyces avermitilis]OOV24741.1 hypothetical protein SM007_28145 [Streptomyces avermitilis]GDY68867.1 hypothetical protein SAV14893_082600 [Streptomyces avermitilis]